MPYRHLANLAACAMLAACAGGYRNDQPFNVWVSDVQRACYYASIGAHQVGSLIGNPGTDSGNYFLDQLEQAFDGRITAQRFASDVAGFLVAKTSDPGMQCVVERIPTPRKPPIY